MSELQPLGHTSAEHARNPTSNEVVAAHRRGEVAALNQGFEPDNEDYGLPDEAPDTASQVSSWRREHRAQQGGRSTGGSGLRQVMNMNVEEQSEVGSKVSRATKMSKKH